MIELDANGKAVQVPCQSCGGVNRVPVARLGDRPVCGRCKRPLAVDAPVALTDGSFDAFVRGASLPVLVDFWAPWCGPCRMVGPELEQLAADKRGSLIVAKLNSDENPQASARHGVQAIPTMILFRGGVEAQRLQGALRAPQIAAALGI